MPEPAAHAPEERTGVTSRLCIVSRTVKDEAELIRFVRAPDGTVVPDLARKLPGRGVWVSLNAAAVAEAVRKNLFSKGFSEASRAPAELPQQLSGLLRKQALACVSLARKAGEAVAGFTKVEEMLGRGRAQVLLHAAEAAADGCRKLDKLLLPGMTRSILFHLDELDLAFGRSNVIHAAVAKGGLADKLQTALRRIEIYEAQPGPKVPEERA